MLTALAEGWEGLILEQALELFWLPPTAPEHLVTVNNPDSMQCTWMLQMLWQTCTY